MSRIMQFPEGKKTILQLGTVQDFCSEVQQGQIFTKFRVFLVAVKEGGVAWERNLNLN